MISALSTAHETGFSELHPEVMAMLASAGWDPDIPVLQESSNQGENFLVSAYI